LRTRSVAPEEDAKRNFKSIQRWFSHTKLFGRVGVSSAVDAYTQSETAMLRNEQSQRMRSKQSVNLRTRYGYLEKAFDGDASRRLA
jgi:hypothetical protein